MPLDAVRQRMIDDLHGAGFTDLVPAHAAVLRYPGPQERRPSDVAAEAGMSRQAMNDLLGSSSSWAISSATTILTISAHDGSS
jgi:hypothetical protein